MTSRSLARYRSRVSMADDLERLADLHERGLLTDGEYAAAKHRLVSERQPSPKPEAAAPTTSSRTGGELLKFGVAIGALVLLGSAVDDCLSSSSARLQRRAAFRS